MTFDQSLRLRHVAPAGAPIRLPDLARWAGLAIAGRDVEESLQRAFCDRFGVRHSFLTCTGRAGMTMLLRALHTLRPDRDEVILPSYTCFSVAASAVKAGLRPRIVDISPASLDYAPDALESADFTRVLAVVATNLYGLPNDMQRIVELARRHGAFAIDDAAQAMGASIQGRPSGTWGDAGLFSFDKGKNVSAIDGGVIVTSSEAVAAALRKAAAALPSPGWAEASTGVAKALVYFLMLRPWLYWIPNRIPQLELGKTVYTTDFPIATPSRSLIALGRVMLGRLDEFTRARVTNAAAFRAALAGTPSVRAISPAANATPVYLRFPVLYADPAARDRAVGALNAAGIGATASYPASLADVAELRRFSVGAGPMEGGRHVAAHIMTLPTHAFVGSADVARAADTIAAIARL